MSKRSEAQVSARAAMRVSHLQQIEALTKVGLTTHQRVAMMTSALNNPSYDPVCEIDPDDIKCYNLSVAQAFWTWSGSNPNSLFAYMDNCACPVQQHLPNVRSHIPYHWKPTAKELEHFSRYQLDYRFPDSPDWS